MIKNKEDRRETGTYAIVYHDLNGAPQSYAQRFALEPQELLVIDIAELRDRAIPSIEGDVLPFELYFGYATVSGSTDFLTSDPTFDPVAGTCGTCMVQCVSTFEIATYSGSRSS